MSDSSPCRFVTREEIQHEDVPWCHLEWLSRPGQVEAEQLMVVRAIMPPGKGHNFHLHPGREEIIYILEGEAEQWVGESSRKLGPGDVAHIPADMVHATFNTSDRELRFLAILGPADTGSDEFTVDVFDQAPWNSIR